MKARSLFAVGEFCVLGFHLGFGFGKMDEEHWLIEGLRRLGYWIPKSWRQKCSSRGNYFDV